MDYLNTEVKRQRYFATSDDVADHMKNVGRAIINDADTIKLQPDKVSGVDILVIIDPDTEVTNIHYSIRRRADPRIKQEAKE